MDGLNLVINITDRDKSETAIRLFQENGVFTTDVALGQGTAPREILEYLYLSPASYYFWRSYQCRTEFPVQNVKAQNVH